MNEVTFELRGLKAEDMFPMFSILSKIGIKDLKDSFTPDRLKELTAVMTSGDASDEQVNTAIGMNLVLEVVSLVMKNISSCKNDIYSLLSSLSGMTTTEIADLDMVTFTEMVIAVVKKDEFKDFFKAVAKLFK